MKIRELGGYKPDAVAHKTCPQVFSDRWNGEWPATVDMSVNKAAKRVAILNRPSTCFPRVFAGEATKND